MKSKSTLILHSPEQIILRICNSSYIPYMSHKTLVTSTVLLLETKYSIPKSIAGISARYGWGINIAPKNCKKLPMYSFADCRDELLQAEAERPRLHFSKLTVSVHLVGFARRLTKRSQGLRISHVQLPAGLASAK